ncbi:MAG: family 10 glycosylhydrolase [Lachnospiraceae bacterium]
MQKRFLLAVLFIAAAAGAIYFFLRQSAQVQPPQEMPATPPTVSASEEVRAVWVNYNELSMKSLGGGTQTDFQNKSEEMCRNIRESGMNTVIVHVRPFCDAFYASELFPWSVYLTGTQGQGVDYDPLGIFLAAAKAQNLSVQAWINPYRVLLSAEWEKLSDNNPAKQWYEAGKTENLLLVEDGIYLNPSSVEAQTLIINGVREILQKYDIDAIHMDDYFYPTNDPSVDAASYASYQQAGGRLSQDDWRRENVSMFVSALYAAIKAQNPQTQLVISPGGDIRKNHDNLYADVERWAREPGFLDVLMPQLYYGFENAAKPFEKTAAEWANLRFAPNVSLCFGLAAYKCGKEDVHAGTGALEWTQQEDILARQLKLCRTLPHYGGFALYTYSSIYMSDSAEIMKKEWKNFRNVLQ